MRCDCAEEKGGCIHPPLSRVLCFHLITLSIKYHLSVNILEDGLLAAVASLWTRLAQNAFLIVDNEITLKFIVRRRVVLWWRSLNFGGFLFHHHHHPNTSVRVEWFVVSRVNGMVVGWTKWDRGRVKLKCQIFVPVLVKLCRLQRRNAEEEERTGTNLLMT